MSDSSEEEDLSRFKEAVDNSFLNLIDISRVKISEHIENDKPTSLRFLDESTHYNDVKVPEELQKHIGLRVSGLIGRNVEFVDIFGNMKLHKVKGDIKLFEDSEEFLSCEVPKDKYTETHNIESKKIKNEHRKRVIGDIEETSENEKVDMVVLSGEYVLSKEETKLWESRRREKLVQYESHGNSKVLTDIE